MSLSYQPISGNLPTKIIHNTTASYHNQGLISLLILHSQFIFTLNSYSSDPNCSRVITIKFCTWHNSHAVVPCAKICSNLTIRQPEHQIEALRQTLFLSNLIGIASEKLLLKWTASSKAEGSQCKYYRHLLGCQSNSLISASMWIIS